MNISKLCSKNYFLFLQSAVSHLSLAIAQAGFALNFIEGLDSNQRGLSRDCGKMVIRSNSASSQLNANRYKRQRVAGFIMACAVLASGSAFGARISDIRGTKHNLSAATAGTPTPSGGSVPARTVKATTETQVCVFCHTPHGATLGVAPLWNRQLSNATYAPYTSSSLDANAIQGTLDQPGGSSKLCLSCHDGTLAIGSVNVLNGLGSPINQGTQTITMTGTDTGGVMPPGSGATTGYTRNLGIDLTNDHPISVNYTTALSDRDGELRRVDANQKYPAGTGTIIGIRSSGYNPKAPLEPTGTGNVGQVQCSACHDPHLRETDAKVGNQKFLILNRFQEISPTPIYSSVNDIGCVACHDKNQGNAGVWAYSAHANQQVATQTYTDTAASQREFPTVAGDGATTNLPVWKAACLNCHDTHSVQGSRWLLREGTDSTATPRAAGNSAIEETCYQCHSNNANTAITPLTNILDIKSDFALPRHQPITLADQGNPIAEAHDIGGNFSPGGIPYEWVDCSATTNKCGADFVEQRSKLGAGTGNLSKRHAECTDCHNPHRVVKFNSFLGNGGSLSGTPDATGTHTHTDTAGYTHDNIASGALRGTFGVEPVYSSASFANLPFGYDVKRGDPGTNSSTLVSAAYVTREYQVCLKCHSDYGYNDDNLPDASTTTRPPLGGSGLTPNGTNGLTHYTNQAKEFQAPLAHRGEVTTTDSGAGGAYSTNNHRSWHPVMDGNPSIAVGTGRTGIIRGNGTDISARWNLPWSNAVGTQTMYCGDCHGSNVTSTTSVIPDSGKSWGSHGSGNDFILKGAWNPSTGDGQTGGLCFKCHDYSTYAAGGGAQTGFFLGGEPAGPTRIDGHTLHFNKIGKMRCNWCHVAVPHGWKNKGLLVNLNDVGPEAGQAAGTEVRNHTTTAYNAAPYYLNAVLKVITFAQSGQWKASDCGSPLASPSGNQQSGKTWMSATFGAPPSNDENCATPP